MTTKKFDPRKEIRDQGAHFCAAFSFIYLARVMGAEIPPYAGAWIAFSLWLAREFTEWQLAANRGRWPWAGHGSVISPGSRRDLIFWALGGAIAGLPSA